MGIRLAVLGSCRHAPRTIFRSVDEALEQPEYSVAQQCYYDDGPAEDWFGRFVSAYASMHPWEDFAETFAAYLDMCAVLITADHFGIAELNVLSLDDMVSKYQRVGIIVNELNRDIGLTDLVPDVFTEPIVRKLRFMHQLRD